MTHPWHRFLTSAGSITLYQIQHPSVHKMPISRFQNAQNIASQRVKGQHRQRSIGHRIANYRLHDDERIERNRNPNKYPSRAQNCLSKNSPLLGKYSHFHLMMRPLRCHPLRNVIDAEKKYLQVPHRRANFPWRVVR